MNREQIINTLRDTQRIYDELTLKAEIAGRTLGLNESSRIELGRDAHTSFVIYNMTPIVSESMTKWFIYVNKWGLEKLPLPSAKYPRTIESIEDFVDFCILNS